MAIFFQNEYNEGLDGVQNRMKKAIRDPSPRLVKQQILPIFVIYFFKLINRIS